VKTPSIVRVNNVGAVFMTENVSMSGCTKHIDVRHHYVWEFVQEGFIKIIFMRLEYNFADGFTKDVSGAIYNAHVTEFMAERSAVTFDKQLTLPTVQWSNFTARVFTENYDPQ
jgi:hypothetical protein